MFHHALLLELAMANVEKGKGKGKGKQVRLTSELVEQQWGILLKGQIMEIPQVILDHIRATPTAIMGWYDQEVMNAWKFIFPLTKESRCLGTISMADPAWQEWENPWWVFLTDLPCLKGEKNSRVEEATFNFGGANLMRIESVRSTNRKANVGGQADCSELLGKHAGEKATPSISPEFPV